MSICLYHRMLVQDRPCVQVELASNYQEVAIGDPQIGAQALEAAPAGLAVRVDPENTFSLFPAIGARRQLCYH